MTKTLYEIDVENAKNSRPIWMVFWVGFFTLLTTQTYMWHETKQEQIRAEESCKANE